MQLWEFQDEQRNWKGCKNLKPNAERLCRIAERLEAGITIEECQEVLEFLSQQANQTPEQREWFNGTTNWRPENFDRSAGRSTTGQTQQQRPGDFGHAE